MWWVDWSPLVAVHNKNGSFTTHFWTAPVASARFALNPNISRENNNEAFVYRVLLRYDAPVLSADWQAWFGEFESDHLTLVNQNAVRLGSASVNWGLSGLPSD